MCGIFGGHAGLLVQDPAGSLRHRGPDQAGSIVIKHRAMEPFTFGMTRLSIVDKHEMAIPFSFGGAYIGFNGEIYNWRDLRNELELHGVRFITQTDTELALHAYLRWGPKCLERFNGMFAIAIWHNGELFLARDRLGKKPLYYMQKGPRFAFASELKAFSELEPTAMPTCEALEFYFDEHVPFKGVRSLKPGEYAVVNLQTGEPRTTQWWSFPSYDGSITDLDVAVDRFLGLFFSACELRRIADVPVTIFLSGGIDSSLIQAVLKLDTAYTIQFPEYAGLIDEEDLVREFARHLEFEARVLYPSREDFLKALPLLARHIEYPVGSLSLFPLHFLAQAARGARYAVAISGEGADELFNGYYRHEILLTEEQSIEHYKHGPYAQLASRYFGSGVDRFCRMALRGSPEQIAALKAMFASAWDGEAPLAYNLSLLEARWFLQPLLMMADRMSMANSLEVRNPFLDHRIIEFSAKLAHSCRFAEGKGKPVLREALHRLVGKRLGITKRTIKHGLPTPVNKWLFNANTNAFDRQSWNTRLRQECAQQLLTRAGSSEARVIS